MPYITQEQRERIKPILEEVIKVGDFTPGELNYLITSIVCLDIEHKAQGIGRISYAHINNAMGVLSCCQAELYRRLGTSVEERAIKKNGDLPCLKM